VLPLGVQRNDSLQNQAQNQAQQFVCHWKADVGCFRLAGCCNAGIRARNTRRHGKTRRVGGVGGLGGWDQAEMSGAPTGPISS